MSAPLFTPGTKVRVRGISVHDGRVGTVEKNPNSAGCITVRLSDAWGDLLSTTADTLEIVQ